MPTDNPKISSYVPQQIYDHFKEYQKQNKLTMSQTVIVILAEYFGLKETLKETNSSSPIGGVTLSAFEELQKRLEKVESEVEYLRSTKNNLEIREEVKDQKESSSQLSLLDKLPNKKYEFMGKDLAIRLGISSGRLSTRRKEMQSNDFQEWTSQQDPNNIKWTYEEKVHGKGFIYIPLTDNSELLSKLYK